MLAVYRLIGLARQYEPDAVEAACSKALPVSAPAGAARFTRDQSEYATGAVATSGTAAASNRTALAAAGPRPRRGRVR